MTFIKSFLPIAWTNPLFLSEEIPSLSLFLPLSSYTHWLTIVLHIIIGLKCSLLYGQTLYLIWEISWSNKNCQTQYRYLFPADSWHRKGNFSLYEAYDEVDQTQLNYGLDFAKELIKKLKKASLWENSTYLHYDIVLGNKDGKEVIKADKYDLIIDKDTQDCLFCEEN